MGHAYVAAEGCEEALLLGVCSSADGQLLESLMTLHGDEAGTTVATVAPRKSAPSSAEEGKSAPPKRTA